MKKINVLVLGGGGREHAIASKLKKSPQAGTIYVAPGNPGTAMAGCVNIPIAPVKENFDILNDISHNLGIRLIIASTDNVLWDGAVDYFTHAGYSVFGPRRLAAQIEWSKVFAKRFMEEVGIPTAPFKVFKDPESAKKYVREKNGWVVIKLDGLALGKGAFPCESVPEAEKVIGMVFTSGNEEKIIIEDRLEGEEISIHELCDGENVKLLPVLRDHKLLKAGPYHSVENPMTGGMGVHGPIDIDQGLLKTIEERIVLPCIRGLDARGTPFRGCLYPGLMLTKEGPMVLEFNSRFGDPETQVLMRLLEDDVDLIDVFMASIEGRLNLTDIRWKNKKGICITAAASGYPNTPRKGDPIRVRSSLEYKDGDTDIALFHCGTAWKDGELVTNGGRVMSYTELIDDGMPETIAGVYKRLYSRIEFADMQVREDIGSTW